MQEATTNAPTLGAICADCLEPLPIFAAGHCGGTGYAEFPDGARVCYPCADVRQRADLAAAQHFGSYLASDGKSLTTWTGGHLARVMSCTVRRVGFGWNPERHYFRAVAFDGSRWYGNSPGPGMYARMHRSR